MCQPGFWLPAEAQKIDRLLDAFAGIYIETYSTYHYQITKADILLLCIAALMLNTNLHIMPSVLDMMDEDITLQKWMIMMPSLNTLPTKLVEDLYSDIRLTPLPVHDYY